MQKDQSDLELIFKKRARRRLVGAIALVLLMIILLPIVLKDRAESDSQQEVTIVMPENYPVDKVASSDDLATAKEVNTIAIVETETLVLPKVETVTANAKEIVEPVKPKVKSKTVVEAKSKTKTTLEQKKAVTKELIKKADLKSIGNKFYVQIGVFSDIANVKKLQVKLDELGYQSVTEKMTTETGEKMRLRTETFVDRNKAVIALEGIKSAGLTGMVVSQK